MLAVIAWPTWRAGFCLGSCRSISAKTRDSIDFMKTLGRTLETLAVILAGVLGLCIGLWKFFATAVLLIGNEILDVWNEK